ncbi:peptidase S41-like protein [Mucilaginibacter frigoritolerans]|uniref:Peptidase S41-like protein n=1 Tax=Mucilaginibacter frigoritolerans TaxID=652788 RepID=A0A562U9B5_9SPHI|nr:S41 family peptidase [Mucilaginibacter frigoritolerans]TWJ02396.1 peptidase S41-like protein [Mucilaginibacter frigoritolerans]
MKVHTIKHLLFIPIVVLLNSCAQPSAKNGDAVQKDSLTKGAALLPVKKMQDDLSILWAAIKEMHPAYGMYSPTDSLNKVYQTVNASLDRPLSENDYITHIYPLLCSLGCGHTQLHHSAGYKPSGIKTPHLPFEVLVSKHRVWITTHKTALLNTGDEILSVNNIPAGTLVNNGYNLYAGDGYNETFKELFLSEYDGFEDVFNSFYHWQPPYKIALRTKQGDLKTISLDTATTKLQPTPKAPDPYANWIEAKGTDYLPLRFLKNSSTAWFQVKSYQYNDTNIYKVAFKQIHDKGVKNLIIDLRHNTGGDIRIASKVLSYLADKPYHILGDIWARIPNPSVNHFEKYFDTARTASFIAGFNPGKKEGAHYHIDVKPTFGNLLGTLPLNKTDHYAGNLYVLIDGATFSAGAHTAISIKTQCKKAIFIGRETLGGAEGCSGGTIQHLTLPNTGVVVDFPWMRFVSVAENSPLGHGIMPDYTVEYSPEDVVNKRDLDLEKALSLIKQVKAER